MMRRRTDSFFLVALAMLVMSSTACKSRSVPGCPEGTADVDGACLPLCTAEADCLPSEFCSPTTGACSPRTTAQDPAIVEFRANRTSVTAGAKVKLRYVVTNADMVEILGVLSPTHVLAQENIETKGITETTTFVLKASGQGKTVNAQVTVTVVADSAVRIESFSADPERINRGASSVLRWSVVNGIGDIVLSNADGPFLTTGDASGSVTVGPLTTTTYTIAAQGPGGPATQPSVVTVLGDSPPTVSRFDALPGTKIAIGDTALLRWRSEFANRISLLANDSVIYTATAPEELSNGTYLVAPDATTRYRLVVENDVLSASSNQLTIEVDDPGPAPEIAWFNASPATFAAITGTTVTLDWSTEHGSSIQILQNGIAIPGIGPSGSLRVGITGTTEFELIVTNARGSITRRAVSWRTQSEVEPNDLQTSGSADQLGDTGRSGTVFSGEVDWYRVGILFGASLRIEISDGAGGCATDTIVELYNGPDSTGLLLGSNDDGGVAGGCSLIDPSYDTYATSLPPGTYYVKVLAGSGGGTGSYVITADLVPSACGNGVVDAGETCEDTNQIDGDGCTSACQIDPAYDYVTDVMGGQTLTETPGDATRLTFRGYPGGTGLAIDEGFSLVPLPFPLKFYGNTYAALIVHTNGFISLYPGSVVERGPLLPFPSPEPANAIIAPFRADLRVQAIGARGSQVSVFETSGATGRLFVVEFANLTNAAPGISPRVFLSARVAFEESTGRIGILYGDHVTQGGGRLSAAAGIEDRTGTFGLPAFPCNDTCTITDLQPRSVVIFHHP